MGRKTRSPTLVLTGQTRARKPHDSPRHEVQVHGQSVWLPPQEFAGLLALMKAKASGKAQARVHPMIVCRIRLEIAKVFDMATAKDLIVSAGESYYFLALEADEITFHPQFRTARMPSRYPALKRLKKAILQAVAELADPST